MTRVGLILLLTTSCAFSQARVFSADWLPPHSIELKAHDKPATKKPWQLPKPGDRLYDAKKEAEINNGNPLHLVHVFERGVFKGYAGVTSGPQPSAEKHGSRFIPNPYLPSDAIELAPGERPDESEYYQELPKTTPVNVPFGFIPVRVFQHDRFIGWTYMAAEDISRLHAPE